MSVRLRSLSRRSSATIPPSSSDSSTPSSEVAANAAGVPDAMFASAPSFTTGQRLRPGIGRNAFAQHRRAPILYGPHAGGKNGIGGTFTRHRVIAIVVLACLCVLVLSYNSVFGHGRPDSPFTELHQQIKSASPTEAPMAVVDTRRASLAPDGGASSAQEMKLRADANVQRLSLVEAELAAQQVANSKLRIDLEAARAQLVYATKAPAESTSPVPTSAVSLSSAAAPIEVPSYPPVAISSSKQYSKFYCIGGRGRLGAQNDRSCRFQNICYKPSTNQWQFYQDPKERLVVLLDQGVIIEDFPAEFLNLRSMGNPTDAQWWSPTIVKSAAGIPASAFVPRVDPAKPNVNVLYHPHYPSNMGHVIGDDLFPIFNLMSSFGMLVTDAQLIISRDCGRIFANNPKKAEQCDFFLKMLIPGLSSKEYLAATAPDFMSRVRGAAAPAGDSDLVCFEQLLAGNGPWGFQQSLGKAPSWWSYHAFYLNNLGINPNRTPKKHRITVSIKKGKRALANNDELVTYLKQKFPTYEIDALELRTLGGWKNELEYLLDTSILITPCGGVSMSAMFLPHNSAMVIVDYFNLRKNVSFGMEERLWTNLGFVRPYHYPFTIDEVELPDDRKRTDYQDMRDWSETGSEGRQACYALRSVSHTTPPLSDCCSSVVLLLLFVGVKFVWTSTAWAPS